MDVSGPGEVSNWYVDGTDVFFYYGSGTNETVYDDLWYLGDRYDIWLQFATLGTYTVKQTIKAKYDDDTTDTADPIEYTDSGTYTFHVGPMAELEVRQGGASPVLDENQYALTVEALTHGPDDPLDAEVAIELILPTGVSVVEPPIASHGTYSSGTWDLGEDLKTPDYRRSQGIHEASTLTFILEGEGAANARARATIANVQDYTVCIDSDGDDVVAANETACTNTTGNTWHSTAVYDYDTSNNSAMITAQAGTGGVGPDIPALATPTLHAPVVGVSWSELEYLYGVPVSHYETQWSPNGESGWTQLQTDLTFNELIDLTIASGVTRYYRVRAVSEAMVDEEHITGPWSAPVVVRTGGAEVTPGAPTNVSASADGGNAIDVSWSPPEDDGGFDVTGYQVQWSADGAGGWRTLATLDAPTDPTATVTHTDAGLGFGTERYYQVRAQNDAGWGGWSATVSATTLAGVPGTPNLTARANGATEISLSWTEPADNGSAITRYEIERSLDGSTWSSLVTTDPSVRTHTDEGLDPGTTYYYHVRAVNSAMPGLGSWSTARSATTRAQMPGIPQNLGAAADGENAIIVTWAEPADDGGSAITSYQVELRAVTESGGLGSASPRTVNASSQEYRHSGLTVGSTWQYRVQARNAAGWGEWSDPVQASTLSGVPAAPGSFQALANGPTEIVLTWTEPDDRGEPVSFYEIDWSADGTTDSWSRLISIASVNTTHIDGGLKSETTRHYRVRARATSTGSARGRPRATRPRTPAPSARRRV